MQPEQQNIVAITLRDPGNAPAENASIALAAADAINIVSVDDYTEAAGELKAIKARHDEIEGLRQRLVKPINEAHDRIQEVFRTPLALLKKAEAIVKGKMIAYDNAQDRIRREKQRLVDEAAERERKKLAERAERAQAAGKIEKAAALEQQAAAVVPHIVASMDVHVPGVIRRETWHAECTDLMALWKAIAEGKAALSLVMPNDTVIGQQARSLKNEFVAAGIRVWSDKNLAA